MQSITWTSDKKPGFPPSSSAIRKARLKVPALFNKLFIIRLDLDITNITIKKRLIRIFRCVNATIPLLWTIFTNITIATTYPARLLRDSGGITLNGYYLFLNFMIISAALCFLEIKLIPAIKRSKG
jgi:hypothetical protein